MSNWPDLADSYHRCRLAWADAAFDDFRSTLLPEVRDALSKRRGDTDVVLYGTTRAGKSTLALALLGIPDDDRFAEVERILRGPRAASTESVTIAPTRYVLSDGDHWSFGDGVSPIRPVTQEQVEHEIEAVRAEVSAGNWDPNRILHVGIPARYAPGQTGRTLRLLDLPGVRSGEDRERRYVDTLLPNWIAAADMILLVGSTDRQTFVNPAETRIAALRNWHLLPGRFRVVMTRAYSLMSVMTRIVDDVREADVGAWRTYMAERMTGNADTSVPDVPADRWLHPFDYARSFKVARSGYSEAAWAVVLAARNAALDDLRRTLIRASRSETRIRSAFQAGRVAQQVRDQLVEQLERNVAEATRVLHRVQKSLDVRRRTIEAEEQTLAGLRDRLGTLPDLFARADALTVAATAAEGLDKVEPGTTDELRHALRRALAAELRTWRAHYGRALGAYPFETSPRSYREELDAVLGKVRERRRVKRISAGGRARLAARVRDECATAANGLTGLLRKRARTEADAGRDALAKEIAVAESTLAPARSGVTTTESDWQQALDSVRRAQEHRDDELRKLSEAVTVAHQFPGLLIAAYDRRLQTLLARLATLPNRVEQLAAALAIVDAARLFDAIQGDDVATARHDTAGQTAFDNLIQDVVRAPLNDALGRVTGAVAAGMGTTEKNVAQLGSRVADLEESVRRTHRLLTVVAVSGGVTSVVLLAAIVVLSVVVTTA